jgi:hypothetical protein
MQGIKSRLAVYLIAALAILGGLAFFLVQTSRLFRPESAEIELATLPLGRFNWGFVWSDTLVAGPALLVGGILLLTRKPWIGRLGQLLAFTGFAINLYALIFFWIGLAAIGQPMLGAELWSIVVLTLLSVLCMIYLAIELAGRGPESACQIPRFGENEG